MLARADFCPVVSTVWRGRLTPSKMSYSPIELYSKRAEFSPEISSSLSWNICHTSQWLRNCVPFKWVNGALDHYCSVRWVPPSLHREIWNPMSCAELKRWKTQTWMLPTKVNSKPGQHTEGSMASMQRSLFEPESWTPRLVSQLGILMWLTTIWFGNQWEGGWLLAWSNLVPEILASIQWEMQPKQEGDFGEGWSGVCLLFYQTSVWILAGETWAFNQIFYVCL